MKTGENRLSPILGTLSGARLAPSSCIQHRIPSDMKAFSGSPRPAWQPSWPHAGLHCVLFLGAFIFVAGCGKGENAGPSTATTASPPATVESTPSPTESSPATTNSAADSPPAPAVTISENGSATVLQQLNRALVQFKFQHHRAPATFEDFAASANIQIPAPPAGKKYAINGRGVIVLVDSSTH